MNPTPDMHRDPQHQPPVASEAELERRKKAKVPACCLRLAPGELLQRAPAEGFAPEDNLDLRNFYRCAAGMHRTVRAFAREQLRPGVSMLAASDRIEAFLRETCGNDSAVTVSPSGAKSRNQHYYCGQAFPLGLSVNECAAHYAPLATDDHVVSENDVVKVDFGVHCNGYLIDSAFTMHWNPDFDPVVAASKEATNEAIKLAGVDVPLQELGARIEEVIMSYEYKGKPLQPVRNLSGHMVDRYRVHAGKSIPLYKDCGDKGRMAEGEVYACETFASTGRGRIQDQGPVSHYMLDPKAANLRKDLVSGTDKTRELFALIKNSFSTLAWNPRWLEQLGLERYQLQLDSLVKNESVNPYPKLVDKAGCLVSQFEHTFMVGAWGVEVFSRGDDY